jgi:hypothetical protein
VTFNFIKANYQSRLAVIKSLDGYMSLSDDVQSKIASASPMLLKRLEEAWRALEDCILLSSPEKGGTVPSPFIWRIWRWVISNGVYSVDNVTKAWKTFKKFLSYKNAACSLNEKVELPCGFPASGSFELGRAWYVEFPWLKSAFTSDIKYFQEKLAHLANHRGFPTPAITPKVRGESFDLLRSRLSQKHEISPAICEVIHEASRGLAHYVKAGNVCSNAHVSLSSMASFEVTRNSGGRSIAFCRSFLDSYVRVRSTEDRTGHKTWFGSPYDTVRGRPKFTTMCREHFLKKDWPFLESNFETMFSLPDSPVFQIEEPMIGIDSQLGYQLLQHAIECGIEGGYLEGPPYVVPGSNLVRTEKPLPVNAETVGEAGCKIRWITASTAWENMLLQPLGHELGIILKEDMYLRSGMMRSAKGYDLANDLATANGLLIDLTGDMYVVQGDLEVATDNMVPAYVNSAMKGYLHGAGRGTQFLYLLVDVLTSSHAIYLDKNFEFNSSHGILMGNPGTKAGLSIMNRVARHLAYLRYCMPGLSLRQALSAPYPKNTWHFGRCAGDDFVEFGPSGYLKLLKQTHEGLGHRVGTYVLSQRAISYCEEPLFFQGTKPHPGRKLWQLDSESYDSTIHVDCLKVRTFSPCGPPSGSKEDLRFPVVGKGQQLLKKLDWLNARWHHLRPFLIQRWGFRMRDYMDLKDPYWYLPTWLGGAGVPCPKDKSLLFRDLIEVCPEYMLLVYPLLRGNAPYWLSQVIRGMTNGCVVRGSRLPLMEQAHVTYAIMVELSGNLITEHDAAAKLGLSEAELRNTSRGERRRMIRAHGFIPEFDLDRMIEKMWMIKSHFQSADRLDEKPELKRRLTPKEIWEQIPGIVSSELFLSIPIDGNVREIFLDFLMTGNRPRESEPRYVNISVLARNIDVLRTPLPGSMMDRSVVRGSTADKCY